MHIHRAVALQTWQDVEIEHHRLHRPSSSQKGILQGRVVKKKKKIAGTMKKMRNSRIMFLLNRSKPRTFPSVFDVCFANKVGQGCTIVKVRHDLLFACAFASLRIALSSSTALFRIFSWFRYVPVTNTFLQKKVLVRFPKAVQAVIPVVAFLFQFCHKAIQTVYPYRT